MIKTDCIYFPLDRPCRFHKEKGVKCDGCHNYKPMFINSNKGIKRILIIKLDAMGDVLRSTFILPGLKEKYKKCHITWVVAPQSFDILKENPYIDRICLLDAEIYKQIACEKFNIVINLDLSPASLVLATQAFADKKIGFCLDRRRRIVSSNAYAKKWFEMSASDSEKKKNTRTYQHHMAKIIGLPRSNYEIYTPLNKHSIINAKKFALKHSLSEKTIVGINPGAGRRWKLKKWTDGGYIKIIEKLSAAGAKVLLFGGPLEKDLVSMLTHVSRGKAISAGTDNSILDFFALLNLCDIVLTGDTLTMHAALGLKKKVVVFFGPTSANEIEMYGRGIKVVSPKNCACCYLPECSKKPSCMDLIKPADIWSALQKYLGENIKTLH
ncbi:MAG: glycosyltransferase family 9 protein [Pseudomonadota bacterium]